MTIVDVIGFKGQSASDNARQHVGNVYNMRKRRSDESLRKDERNEVLLKAAREGQLPRVKYLIHHLGVDIDYSDKEGFTALHHGVLSGFEDVVEVLLEAGVDVNAKSDKYGTPLHFAAINGLSGIFHLLLRYRANAKVEHDIVGTVLNCACYCGDIEIVGTLLLLGCSVHEHSDMCISRLPRIAPRINHSLELIERIGEWYCNALAVAVRREHVDLARKLIENGADVNDSHKTWWIIESAKISVKWTLLSTAAYYGNLDLCSLLLDHGASRTSELEGDYEIPALTAIEAGNSACLRMLLERGVLIGPRETDVQHVLSKAIEHERLECLEILIEYGVNINLTHAEWDEGTPLHIAAVYGQLGVVKLLLHGGANPKVRDAFRHTPLDYARMDWVSASEARRSMRAGIVSLLEGI